MVADFSPMADSMARKFIEGELLADDLAFLSEREQEMITGGGIFVNSTLSDGFKKLNGTAKCRGNATSAQAGNLDKNGKLPCFDQCTVEFEVVYPS